MNIKVDGKNIGGSIQAIPSKSAAHRMLILAALAEGESRILCRRVSEDIEATAGVLSALGAGIERIPEGYIVRPIKELPRFSLLDCGESGSTLRFLLPVAAALGANARFVGRGRLPQRPMSDLAEAINAGGAQVTEGGKLPFDLSGKLKSGEYRIGGNVSSQYLSGLLMALPCLEGDSVIVVENGLESAGYVALTMEALALFGADIRREDNVFYVQGGRPYKTPGTVRVEGDYSNGAFFLVAGALSEKGVTVKGLSPKTVQGDRAVLAVLSAFGAKVCEKDGEITVKKGALKGTTVNASNIPDLVPVLSVLAAASEGVTEFTGAGRLRIKESDRIATTVGLINDLGGKAEERPEGLVVYGTGLSGGKTKGKGDHRIVMSAAVASILCPVYIEGAEAVAKSYPDFFEDFEGMGGECVPVDPTGACKAPDAETTESSCETDLQDNTVNEASD